MDKLNVRIIRTSFWRKTKTVYKYAYNFAWPEVKIKAENLTVYYKIWESRIILTTNPDNRKS